MQRPTPDEGAVREQLRAREADGDGAAAEEAAAPEPVTPETEATEEQAPEAEAPQEAEEAPSEPAQPAEPAEPLATAEAQRDEYLELARRTQADFENYRKRTAQQSATAGERAKLGLLRELLPVLDNLERALASAGESEDQALAEGVKLVLADLQGVLAREGVEALDPVGEEFDPNVHEALSTHAQDGAQPGTVLDVIQKGYRTSDTVIRPARVVVSA